MQTGFAWFLVAVVVVGAACGDDDETGTPDGGEIADAGPSDGGPPACPSGMREWPLTPFSGSGDSPAFPSSEPAGKGGGPLPFLWGAATAPHQVEGGNTESDWWVWEEMGRASGESSDDGPNHWDKYEEDFDLMVADGMNGYRMGIEWAKLFPTRESFDALTPDAAAVQHYHDVFAALEARGIEPMVTLHHFVSPIWMVDPRASVEARRMQGFVSPTIVEDFERFATWAGTEYGGEVDLWITINEPIVVVLAGYLAGNFPPGLVYDPADDLLVRAVLGEIYSHGAAYDALHAADTVDADGDGSAALVSIAKHQRVVIPQSPCSTRDVEAAASIRYLSNTLFLNAIVNGDVDGNGDGDLDDAEDVRADPALVGRADFIGVNYYSFSLTNGSVPISDLVPAIPQLVDSVTGSPVNDLGWAIYPEGFREVLAETAAYGLPLYVTENGIADAGDGSRAPFVAQHLWVLADAIANDGLDVRGYFHWSLMDNFEWAEGYCPRFGLYRVDYEDPDRARSETEGARVYRDIIAAGRVPGTLLDTYPTYPDPVRCE
jgi:beta-glucosidase/6-phospho-beta-glucosidase/beta-galactosidase